MDSISAVLALKALDGLSRRTEIIAENIANAGTENYRPLGVTFEQALRTAAGKSEADLRAVEPEIIATTDPLHPPELRLDMELAKAAETGSRYNAVLEVLNRRLQIDALAVSKDH